MDDLLREFLTETFENLDVVDQELVRFERNPKEKDALDKIFRLVHTVKGACGFLALMRLEALAHAAETLLGMFRDGTLDVTPSAVSLILKSIDRIKFILAGLEETAEEPAGEDSDLIAGLEAVAGKSRAAEPNKNSTAIENARDELETVFSESVIAQQSIRVDVALLERMMTLVSELVLTRNQLMQMVRARENSEFKAPLQRLSNITSDLQDGVMKTRMQPIGKAWAKLPRLVRDLGLELGKKIMLERSGAETELDRQVLELIKDPLVHMIRNSADHGLETPAERRAAGKSEQGHITLNAYHEGGHIVIELADDGRGLNWTKIRERLLREGRVGEGELARMSEQQIQNFVFQPGFSTADEVTSISGRGVGLDVVRANIEQMGGTIDLRSAQGKGTRFTIKIPLTLTIVSALIVEAGGQRFAIPQISVTELVRAKPRTDCAIEAIHDTAVLRLRNRLLPLVGLAQVLGLEAPSAIELAHHPAFVVVAQVGSRSFGIAVDRVYDTEEIVVKPVASILRHLTTFSGNTILGDGKVIMIVDPHGIAATIGEDAPQETETSVLSPEADERAEDKIALLVFRAGGKEQKAVPLSLVTRLEEIESGRIERADGRLVTQYRGRLMPLLHVGQVPSTRAVARQPILVFADSERAAGLVVDEIIDITEEKLEIELQSRQPGVLGLATIKGRATEIVDVGYYIGEVHADWMLAQLAAVTRTLKGEAA